MQQKKLDGRRDIRKIEFVQRSKTCCPTALDLYEEPIMSAIPQQVFATQKASLDNLLAVQGAFFDGFEKLVDLNLKVMKATLDEAAQKSQEAIEVKDAQEAVAFTSSLVQPSAEKSLAYGKHVYDIVSTVQGNLNRLTEGQVAQPQQ